MYTVLKISVKESTSLKEIFIPKLLMQCLNFQFHILRKCGRIEESNKVFAILLESCFDLIVILQKLTFCTSVTVLDKRELVEQVLVLDWMLRQSNELR